MNTPPFPSLRVQWSVSLRASCLHAAEATAHGQLVADSRLAEAIAEPAQELRNLIAGAGLPRDVFWRNLVGLSVLIDTLPELCERAITKTAGAQQARSLAVHLTAAVAGVEAAMRRTYPTLSEDLALRVRPLREQWEARGPGLLRSIARWTDPRLIAAEAQAVLVHPCLGGGGTAHIPFNNVHIEAVLVDPLPEIPEIVRLGWLLAQLNLDLPIFSDHISGRRLDHVAELAMLPVTLQAAEELELLRFQPEILDRALSAWHIVTPPHIDPVDVLWRWWGTYGDTRPRWDIAFTALDRMTAEPPAA